ncbi:TrkH family potassium uptake protein [Rubrobacter aplysinae]|uniref:TrkH family potassium uptake protein n=1 Tax=Rubrobacter aplysinae TaxID=909625 RepID=UPI00064BC518|nr:TrkH family potassium uptake protein [Rubrobacter aplysinae]
MHPRLIASAVGIVVASGGTVMLVPALYALLTGGSVLILLVPALAAVTIGIATFAVLRPRSRAMYTSIRDVFLIVVLSWFGVAMVGTLPYILSGTLSPVEAYFEAMAGFTTTGASNLVQIEEVEPALLLWRSLTQWTGGIGIVLLFVAVGPLVGFGSSQLYSAEMPDPVGERITPRIRDTAKGLAYIYLVLTAGGVAALWVAGMGLFDALNHSLTTVATGGYSTRSEGIGAFDSVLVELAITGGMLLSGSSFVVYFLAAQGRLRRVAGNREIIAYFTFFVVGAVVVGTGLLTNNERDTFGAAALDAVFHSASLLTGTGYATADWGSWDPLSASVLMVLMAIGGCAGSTSGGIKVVRVILLARHAAQEVFRIIHPRAVTPLRLGQQVIPERLRTAFLGFFFLYALTLVIGTILISPYVPTSGQAFGAVFACLNITGTALGPVGDTAFYVGLPAVAKVELTIFMLLGRLELFTLLVVLTPAFWRR